MTKCNRVLNALLIQNSDLQPVERCYGKKPHSLIVCD